MTRLEDVLNTEKKINLGLKIVEYTKIYDKYFKIFEEKHKEDLGPMFLRFHTEMNYELSEDEKKLKEVIFNLQETYNTLENEGVPLLLISEISNRVFNKNTPEKYVERKIVD